MHCPQSYLTRIYLSIFLWYKGTLKRKIIFLALVNYSFTTPKSPHLQRHNTREENTGHNATLTYDAKLSPIESKISMTFTTTCVVSAG